MLTHLDDKGTQLCEMILFYAFSFNGDHNVVYKLHMGPLEQNEGSKFIATRIHIGPIFIHMKIESSLIPEFCLRHMG